MPFYERQPYISPLHQIVAEVLRGEILIPRFQRPDTEWNEVQRGDLLDSLYRGFPIGTILLWSTTRPLKTREVVGGFRIHRSPREGQRLLLDGHQRLSSLVRILGPGLVRDLQLLNIEQVAEEGDTAEREERWVFELNSKQDDTPLKSRDRFVLLKPGHEPTRTQLPLRIALSRAELNRWVRAQGEALGEAQMTEVDALRDRLREYNIPVAVLAVDSLQDATESFKRINSSGTPMTDFNMVAALAYRDDFDPQALFEQYRSEQLEPLGWDGLPDMDLLRVSAALADQHPAKMEVDKLAEQLGKDQTLFPRSFQAVASAARILGEICGITGPEVLPYSWQLITLAVCLGRDEIDLSAPRIRDAVRRWFWLTTYGEVYAGVNSAIYDRSIRALREMMQGGTFRAMDRDLTNEVRPAGAFDFRAARSKAVALAMARNQDGGNLSGAAHRSLAAGIEAVGVLQASGRRSDWWNRVVLSQEESIERYRTALKRRSEGKSDAEDDALLTRIGIPPAAQGTIVELLDARRETIAGEERQFIKQLGLEWAEPG